jgi:hypothetical protein
MARIQSSGQIHGQTNRVPVSVPRPRFRTVSVPRWELNGYVGFWSLRDAFHMQNESDCWFRAGGSLTGPLKYDGILPRLTRHVTKSFDLSGHLGNVG